MSLLTSFVQPANIPSQVKRKAISGTNAIYNLRLAYDTFRDKGITQYFNSDLRKKILDTERDYYESIWQEHGYIPQEANNIDLMVDIFGNKGQYTYLPRLSSYPTVELGKLKEIADSLGFVIIPIPYVRIKSVFEQYDEIDYKYGKALNYHYTSFSNTINEVNGTISEKQEIYFLGPISFYDLWSEVSADNPKPKYFSSKLFNIASTLGLLMPAQRNLYKMTKTNSENITSLQSTMKENFRIMEKNIADCHARIDSIERINEQLQRTITAQKEKLRESQLRVFELERQIACMLDPIIFSTSEKVDVSDPKHNNAICRIAMCFGPEMPVDFFISNGLTEINSKVFDEVNMPFQIKISEIKST